MTLVIQHSLPAGSILFELQPGKVSKEKVLCWNSVSFALTETRYGSGCVSRKIVERTKFCENLIGSVRTLLGFILKEMSLICVNINFIRQTRFIANALAILQHFSTSCHIIPHHTILYHTALDQATLHLNLPQSEIFEERFPLCYSRKKNYYHKQALSY